MLHTPYTPTHQNRIHNVACANSEYSDQAMEMCGIVRVFICHTSHIVGTAILA